MRAVPAAETIGDRLADRWQRKRVGRSGGETVRIAEIVELEGALLVILLGDPQALEASSDPPGVCEQR